MKTRLACSLIGIALSAATGWCQETSPAAAAPGSGSGISVEVVTITVDEAPITQVLNAFSRQTGKSIVVGPEVAGKVTARLTNIPWREALDTILRPYGFGYYLVGDTIVIGSLDKLPKSVQGQPVGGAGAPAVEPLIVKVFQLKYLDASDAEELIKVQLSPSGKFSKLMIRSQTWEEKEDTGTKSSTSSETLGRLKRIQEKQEQSRGTTVVVVVSSHCWGEPYY